MLTLTTLEKNKIQDFIGKTLKNSHLEFEAKIHNDVSPLTQTDFINVIKKIKSLGFKNETVNEMILDVRFEDDETIRVTIHGDDNIKKYCHENSISKIKDSLEFIEKKRFSIGQVETRPLDLRNYDIRVNLKEEKNLPPKNKSVLSLTQRFNSLPKSYRYKKRFSFISEDKLFKFDFTIVKASTKKEIFYPRKKISKGEVLERMKKYVVKPKSVTTPFTTWWESLQDHELVTLREQTYYKNMFFKNLKDSDTLVNNMEYEIELEFIGTKNKEVMDKHSTKELAKLVEESLHKNLNIICQSLQRSEFVISNREKKQVRENFQKLTSFTRFTDSMPMAITLERNNIIELNPDDYEKSVNIRKNYSVTEKTDGERSILFINEAGDIYLVNRQNNIKKIGVKSLNCQNTVIDGEFVDKNLSGKPIRLFLAFDIYFSCGKDFRENILMRSSKDIEDGEYDKSRLEELEDIIQKLDLEKEPAENDFTIEKKIFKFGNVIEDEVDYTNIIEEREEYLLNHSSDITELSKQKLFADIQLAKQSSKIFEESGKILTQISAGQYNYQTDGLIYTPIYMSVGQGERKRNKYGGRWGSLLKWKPIEDNTIDFKVKILTDESGREVEKYMSEGDEVVVYKKVKLLVGYDKEVHKLLNGFRVLNEDPSFLDGYSMIPFEPLDPFSNKIAECNIRVSKKGLVATNGDVITNDSIIEFKWDKTAQKGFNWIPIRKRDNLVPNAYSTACNVWQTIFKPITTEMISTGLNIPFNYYDSNTRKTGSMKKVYKFHNLVKKAILHKHCDKGSRVLDIGCGEMGDLLKYLDLELDLLVALDSNKHNLINSRKGALKRIFEQQSLMENEDTDSSMLDRTFLIWADARKNISSGAAGLDSLHKFYLDVLYGNVVNREHLERLGGNKMKQFRGVAKGKFDLVSCQFAMHYFFQNTHSIHAFLLNLSENLKVGGKFVATCFDGEKIFKLLENKKMVEHKTQNNKLLWRIEKKYEVKKYTNDEKCLSLPIDVYIETFSKSFEEYLINFKYLEEIMPLYGLEIQKVKSFADLQKEIRYQELDTEQEAFSYLNSFILVTKTRDIEVDDVTLKNNNKNYLDIFISKKEQLGGGITDEEDILDDEEYNNDFSQSGGDVDDDDNDDEDDENLHEAKDTLEASTDIKQSKSVDLDELTVDEGNDGDDEDQQDELDEDNDADEPHEAKVFKEHQVLDLTDLEPVNLESTDMDLQEVNLGGKSQLVGGTKSDEIKSQELEELKTEKLSSLLESPDLTKSDLELMSVQKSLGSELEDLNQNNLENLNEEMHSINSKLNEIKTHNSTTETNSQEEVEEPSKANKDIKVIKIVGTGK